MTRAVLLTLCIFLSGCLVGPDFNRARGPAGDRIFYLSRQGVTLFKTKAPAGTWWVGYSGAFGRQVVKRGAINFLENSLDGRGLPSVSMFIDFTPIASRKDFGKWSSFLVSESGEAKGGNGQGASTDNEEGEDGSTSLYIDGAKCLRSEDVDSRSQIYQQVVTCPVLFRNTFGLVSLQVSVSLRDGLQSAKDRLRSVESSTQRSFDEFRFIEPYSQSIPAEFSPESQIERVKSGVFKL
jgi:hypothetical protein